MQWWNKSYGWRKFEKVIKFYAPTSSIFQSNNFNGDLIVAEEFLETVP